MTSIGETYGGGKSPELLELAWTLLTQEWDTLRKTCEINARKSRGRDTWEEAMSFLAAHLPDDVLGWDPSGGKSLRSHVIGNARWRLFKEFVTRRRRREGREVSMSKLAAGDDHGDEAWRTDDKVDKRRSRNDGQSSPMALRDSASSMTHDDADEVRYVLDRVGDDAATLLTMRHAAELTYQEMAEALGCSKSMAYRLTQSATDMAREVAEELSAERSARSANRSSGCPDEPRGGCLCRPGQAERCATHEALGTSGHSTPIAHLIATTLAGVMGTSGESEIR